MARSEETMSKVGRGFSEGGVGSLILAVVVVGGWYEGGRVEVGGLEVAVVRKTPSDVLSFRQ